MCILFIYFSKSKSIKINLTRTTSVFSSPEQANMHACRQLSSGPNDNSSSCCFNYMYLSIRLHNFYGSYQSLSCAYSVVVSPYRLRTASAKSKVSLSKVS